MSGDDDAPHLTDDELVELLRAWLDQPFELHPALMRLLAERFMALAAEARQRPQPKTRGRPRRDLEVVTAVERHCKEGHAPAEARRRAAAELHMTEPGVRKALREHYRRCGMGCDETGWPRDPDHPWNRWRPEQK
jgi:hypothetical protein